MAQGRPRRLRARLARQSPSPSCGARSPGSACSPTRASSTWACSPSASRSRTRWRWQVSSCTCPATRSPRLSASMQRHRLLGHVSGRRRSRRDRGRAHVACTRRVDGDLARDARRPAAVAALRQRGADRGGRLRRRKDVGGGGRGRAPRTRLPRARHMRCSRRSPGRHAAARRGRRRDCALSSRSPSSPRPPCSRSPYSLRGCPAPSSSRPCWERA